MALRHLVSVVVLVEVSFKSTPPQALESSSGVTTTSNNGCRFSMVE